MKSFGILPCPKCPETKKNDKKWSHTKQIVRMYLHTHPLDLQSSFFLFLYA